MSQDDDLSGNVKLFYSCRVGDAHEARIRYVFKQFPFVRRALFLFGAVPALSLMGLTFPAFAPLHFLMKLFDGFEVPNIWKALAVSVMLGCLCHFLLRILNPLRIEYVQSKFTALFKPEQVRLELGDERLLVQAADTETKARYSAIHAITLDKNGLSIGMGLSCIFVPRAAVKDRQLLFEFASALKGKLGEEAVKRSVISNV